MAMTSLYVSPFSWEGPGGRSQLRLGGQVASRAWSNNLIVYNPIYISYACTVYRFWWTNGGTAGFNVQVGIYNDGSVGPTTAVLRGTTTLSAGTSAIQYDDIADTALTPGHYWLALWSASSSQTFISTLPAGALNRHGAGLREVNAGGLPATATPVGNNNNNTAMYGFTTIASP